MTLYTFRVAFLAPIAQAEACNRVANAFGREGDNFSVLLSSDGETVTHRGGSTIETEAFVAALSSAPAFPEGWDLPPGLAEVDWQVTADHLLFAFGAVETTDTSSQFNALIAAHGLAVISNPDIA
ncbi:hypothetical protein [Arenibacterium sp. LLYu02]|uniref:hypothetical protein n=1 Tax=Arenibacterium sp. LLYu02 TaxID=3404132 RepID=UPI003B21443C